MEQNPFAPAFGKMPETIPVFPLPGVLLLPSGNLPLNIFEKRYLKMVEDAMASSRMIGMIQPTLTLVMGGLIFWVIAAVFGPLYQSFSNMKF